ncbi:MAG: LysM peptidoglycan-binding domain-containing protein [Thermodesulfobacteriota bacterium]
MKNDPGLQTNNVRSDDRNYSPKRRGIGSGNSKSLRILIVILLVLFFFGGILYFFSRRPPSGEATLLQSKVPALEQKIAEIEKQLTELQVKISTSGPDPALLQRLDALAQKVETLEKQKQPAADSKAKPSAPSKPIVSTGKQYHTVQKGETLYRISKKYRISVEELRKLNNLSAEQPLRTGEKLLVSPGR